MLQKIKVGSCKKFKKMSFRQAGKVTHHNIVHVNLCDDSLIMWHQLKTLLLSIIVLT